jgi:hypothetical protein
MEADFMSETPTNKDQSDAMRQAEVSVHVCHQPGMMMEDTKIEQMPDGKWVARAKMGSVFGVEVEGELTGEGDTKEDALAALKKNQDEMYEVLWL